MANSTFLYVNISQVSISSLGNFDLVRTTFMVVMLSSFCFFLYFIIIILNVYFTTPHARETARYVLFAHMLANDAVHLFISLILFICAIHFLYISTPICCILVTVSAATFSVTPVNLAVMSIERYVAICFPLQHVQFCTSQRLRAAIAGIWALGLLPVIVDLIFLIFYANKDFYNQKLFCASASLLLNSAQGTLRSLFLILSLTLVALAIVLTYIKVMIVAHRITSGKSLAFKAGRTVILHAFQLLLCTMSFTSPFIEAYLKDHFVYIRLTNYVLLFFLPRFISPLIYGIRDEMFGKHIRNLCISLKCK